MIDKRDTVTVWKPVHPEFRRWLFIWDWLVSCTLSFFMLVPWLVSLLRNKWLRCCLLCVMPVTKFFKHYFFYIQMFHRSGFKIDIWKLLIEILFNQKCNITKQIKTPLIVFHSWWQYMSIFSSFIILLM